LLDRIALISGVSENVARYLFKNILAAVENCHLKGICHRALSLKSFMLDKDYNIKLSSFSSAKCFKDGPISGKCGENYCQPPEMQAQILYLGKEIDIFQLGVCLFMILTNEKPFDNALPDDKYYKCIAANR
jgi:serine/threonine protein kinase